MKTYKELVQNSWNKAKLSAAIEYLEKNDLVKEYQSEYNDMIEELIRLELIN